MATTALELDWTNAEVQDKTDKEIGNGIAEYNLWRRGRGKYEFQPNPADNLPCPFTARTIGYILDEAARRLKGEEVEDA